jgi:hypothetical protein
MPFQNKLLFYGLLCRIDYLYIGDRVLVWGYKGDTLFFVGMVLRAGTIFSFPAVLLLGFGELVCRDVILWLLLQIGQKSSMLGAGNGNQNPWRVSSVG